MSETLVKVENASKKFCRSLKRSLWYGMKDLGSELIGSSGSKEELRQDEFWAVKDVSFELKRGECLGLIGRNGAGKTTLLRMLNGLIKPDKGRIEMKGRVGALIALGAGFNPILSGRENICANGSIIGLSKKEINERTDEIVEFAELEDFIDSPIQSYSSGMAVRLGFAVAAFLKPDVLILDEVLAVGDLAFKAKCFDRISKVLENGAVIFVSHNITQIGRICNNTLFLQKGEPQYLGKTTKALSAYTESLYSKIKKKHLSTGSLEIKDIKISGIKKKGQNDKIVDPEVLAILNFNEKFQAKICLSCYKSIENVAIVLNFRTLDKKLVAESNSMLSQALFNFIKDKSYTIEIEFSRVQLNPGKYSIDILLMSSNMLFHHEMILNSGYIIITGSRSNTADYQFIANWNYYVS